MVLLAAAASAGCAQIVGIEEWSLGSGGATGSGVTATGASVSATTDTSSSSGGACARCVPAAPPGWSGPLFVSTGGRPCTAPSVSPFTGHQGLTSPAECHGCACEPSVANCAHVLFDFGKDSSCDGQIGLPPTQCVNDGGSIASVGAATPVNQASFCVASKASAPLPDEVTWGTDYTACVPPPPNSTNSACGTTETCFPDSPGSGAVCVYLSGADNVCVGEYKAKQVVYTDVVDKRTCDPCCAGEQALGVQCAGVVQTFTAPDCAGAPFHTVNTNVGCSTGNGTQIASVKYTPGSLGTCNAGAVKALGAAQPTGPITICCLE